MMSWRLWNTWDFLLFSRLFSTFISTWTSFKSLTSHRLVSDLKDVYVDIDIVLYHLNLLAKNHHSIIGMTVLTNQYITLFKMAEKFLWGLFATPKGLKFCICRVNSPRVCNKQNRNTNLQNKQKFPVKHVKDKSSLSMLPPCQQEQHSSRNRHPSLVSNSFQ